MNRKWIGSEISKEYVEIANERIKEYMINNLFSAK
jgi:DNA modification methylase